MPIFRAAILALLIAQPAIMGQPVAEAKYRAIKPVLDSIYAAHYPGKVPLEELKRRAAAVVHKALEASDDQADETAAILLQVGAADAYPALKSAIIQRGEKMLPHLRKYRDTPFWVPVGEYKYGVHSSPSARRGYYDEVIAAIQKRPYYGLPPEVERLLLPFLDRYTKPVGDNAAFKYFLRVLDGTESASDEAIVILSDYLLESAYSFALDDEMIKRGARLLPLLRKRMSDMGVTLERRYPKKFLDPRRRERIEDWIEAIEFGETERPPF